jgi:hypothetical protein
MRVFGQPIPTAPRHFVLQLEDGSPAAPPQVLGYVHAQAFGDSYLGGGMAVDAWKFRQLPPELQAQVRGRGGMAQWLLAEACERVRPCLAIYAYVGDAKAEMIDIRVGFRPTGHKHLLVLACDDSASAEALSRRTEAVAAYGPF